MAELPAPTPGPREHRSGPKTASPGLVPPACTGVLVEGDRATRLLRSAKIIWTQAKPAMTALTSTSAATATLRLSPLPFPALRRPHRLNLRRHYLEWCSSGAYATRPQWGALCRTIRALGIRLPGAAGDFRGQHIGIAWRQHADGTCIVDTAPDWTAAYGPEFFLGLAGLDVATASQTPPDPTPYSAAAGVPTKGVARLDRVAAHFPSGSCLASDRLLLAFCLEGGGLGFVRLSVVTGQGRP